MTSYGFNITIAQPDLANLANGGYNFGVQKSTAGGSPLQWLGVPLLAGNIQIRYTVEYQVFYTTTFYQNGAQIMETAYQLTNMGNSWSYQPATGFTSTVLSPPVGPSSAAVLNNLGGYASYGLAQAASVNGAPSTFSPLAVVPSLPNGGTATFTPSQSLTIYFIYQTVSNGTVATGMTSPYPITLSANVFPTYSFSNSNWSLQASPALRSATAHLPLYKTIESGPIRKFRALLTFPTPNSDIEAWLTKEFKTAVHVTKARGNELEVIVAGKEQLPSYADLIFEKVDQTRVAPHILERRVREVRLLELEEEHDLETFLANGGKLHA